MAIRATIMNYAEAGEIVKEINNIESDLLDVRFHAREALKKVLLDYLPERSERLFWRWSISTKGLLRTVTIGQLLDILKDWERGA